MRAGVGTSAVIIAVSIASAIGLRAAASDTEVAGCAIRFYDTHAGERVRADDPVLQGPRANVWVTWVS